MNPQEQLDLRGVLLSQPLWAVQCPSLTDVLLLVKKRAPALLPKMADVVAEEKVSLNWD